MKLTIEKAGEMLEEARKKAKDDRWIRPLRMCWR